MSDRRSLGDLDATVVLPVVAPTPRPESPQQWFPWDAEATVRMPVLTLPEEIRGPSGQRRPGGIRRWVRDLVPGGAVGRRMAVMSLVDSAGTGAFMTVSVIFLTRSVGLPLAGVTLGLSLAGVVALATGVPIGGLADRFGPKPILIAASIWRTIGYGLYPFVGGLPAFIVLTCAIAIVDRTTGPMTQALVGQVVPAEDRARTMAVMRSLRNVGFTLGAMIGSVALTADTGWVYTAVLMLNAASYAGFGALAATLRPESGQDRKIRRTISFGVLKDRPYLTIASMNSVLTVHMPLLSIGLPLLITESAAPLAVLAPLLAVNTVLAVVFQIRASRGAETPSGAARLMRHAGLSLAVCCAVLALVPSVASPIMVVVLLVLGVVALTAGELYQSAGSWGLSYELALDGQQGAYLSVFWLGVSVQRIVAPLVLALLLTAGAAGWLALAAVVAVIGLLTPTATRWAERGRPRAVAE